MGADDQQSGSHRVAQQSDKGIVEANAVQVQVSCLMNQRPEFVMRSDKCPQDFFTALVGFRYALSWRFHFPARWRFHLIDEPTPEPARLNWLAWHYRVFVGLAHRGTQRRRQNGVHLPKMRKALRHAPGPWTGLPVEMCVAQAGDKLARIFVSPVQLVQDCLQICRKWLVRDLRLAGHVRPASHILATGNWQLAISD